MGCGRKKPDYQEPITAIVQAARYELVSRSFQQKSPKTTKNAFTFKQTVKTANRSLNSRLNIMALDKLGMFKMWLSGLFPGSSVMWLSGLLFLIRNIIDAIFRPLAIKGNHQDIHWPGVRFGYLDFCGFLRS